MGAPSKFKEAFCKQLIDHMSEGADFRSFAGKISVTERTIHGWKKTQPSFAEAYALAVEKCYTWWEKLSRARKTDKNAMDTGMFVINMRNRFQWSTRDKEPDQLDRPLTEDEIYAQWEKNRSER